MLTHCVNIYKVKPSLKHVDFRKIILAIFTKFGIKSGAGEREATYVQASVQWDCGLGASQWGQCDW